MCPPSEVMLLKLKLQFESTRKVFLRRDAILKIQAERKSHISIIKKFLKEKYNLVRTSIDELYEAQRSKLINEIKTRFLHKNLMEGLENELVSVKNSTMWLQKGNDSARNEGKLCFLQDRNVFFNESNNMCPHCNQAKRMVNHLATWCEKMLGHDYMRRHNEIVKCLHMLLCNKYKVEQSGKKLRTHSVQQVVANKFVEIRVGTTIKTDIKIKYNKTDIVVIDKKLKEILIIEICVTSIDNIQQVESEKRCENVTSWLMS